MKFSIVYSSLPFLASTASMVTVGVSEPIFLTDKLLEIMDNPKEDLFQLIHIQGASLPNPAQNSRDIVRERVSIKEQENVQKMIQKMKEGKDNGKVGRSLRITGHLSDILNNRCSSSAVYSQTDYDNIYQPQCQCVEAANGVTNLECYLEQTCVDDVCELTTELFYFSDADGDLTTKATCNFCSSSNCEGVVQVCTSVAFNDDFEPQICQLATIPRTSNETSQTCSDCSICGEGTEESPFGIDHSCFGEPTNGCDTEQFAHLHNFLPIRVGDSVIEGTFQNVCQESSIDRALYESVEYQGEYSIVCDCDDPTSGIINCDLHDDACFANTCTDLSETFHFSEFDGNFEYKETIDWNSFIWTRVTFDPFAGTPTACSLISPDPITQQRFRCDTCTICTDENGATGITYDCFNREQTTCDTTDGRTIFNVPLAEAPATEAPTTSPVEATIAPVTPTEAPIDAGISDLNAETPSDDGDDDNNLGLALGLAGAGILIVLVVAVVVNRSKGPKPETSGHVMETNEVIA